MTSTADSERLFVTVTSNTPSGFAGVTTVSSVEDTKVTDERLKALAEARHMTIADSRNLADALHFIQQQRIKHQCEQILKGEKVSNFLNPRDLPKMAKEQLRDAFTIIDEAQSAVRQSYRAGMG